MSMSKMNKLKNFINSLLSLFYFLDEKEIRRECKELEEFLVMKNKSYGSSALRPIRIFSKAGVDEQIRVRLDDKLSRIKRGNMEVENFEDTVRDIAGYCILLLRQLKQQKRKEERFKEENFPVFGIDFADPIPRITVGYFNGSNLFLDLMEIDPIPDERKNKYYEQLFEGLDTSNIIYSLYKKEYAVEEENWLLGDKYYILRIELVRSRENKIGIVLFNEIGWARMWFLELKFPESLIFMGNNISNEALRALDLFMGKVFWEMVNLRDKFDDNLPVEMILGTHEIHIGRYGNISYKIRGNLYTIDSTGVTETELKSNTKEDREKEAKK